MKRYKVIKFLSRSGEDIHILLGIDGTPCYLPNLFVTANLRQGTSSLTTIRQHLGAIHLSMEWFAARTGGDFNDRMLNGDPLLFEEAKPLGDFLKLTARCRNLALASECESRNRENRKPKAGRIGSVRAMHGSFAEPADRIGDSTAAYIIKCVCAYLEWLYKLRLRPPLSENFGSDRRCLAKEGVAQLRAQAPRIRVRETEDEGLWSLPAGTVELVESIIHPDSDRNPWKSPFLAARNYLIWKVYHDTGGRRSEVLNVKVGDLDLSVPCVTFRISKTIPRTVPVTVETGILINRFIMEHWQHLPEPARLFDYLFTGPHGHRLVAASMNRIFERIRQSDPGIPDWLTPHTMRRTWNENLSRAIDALPEGEKWSPAKEAMVRNRLMGWSQTGNTASVYLRRLTRESASGIVERMFADIGPAAGAEEGGGGKDAK